MANSDPTLDADADAPVQYETDAFERAVAALLGGEDEAPKARILFYGGTREVRQQALTTVTGHTAASVHQFRVPSLLSEQRMQTQNALRKAFDHAAEESALLYFDAADALFTHSHGDTPGDSEGSAVPSTVEYFFDRVVAYGGVVVLAFQKQSHVDWADEHVHLVVRFE